MFSTLKIGVVVLTCPPILPKSRGWGGGGAWSNYAFELYSPIAMALSQHGSPSNNLFSDSGFCVQGFKMTFSKRV